MNYPDNRWKDVRFMEWIVAGFRIGENELQNHVSDNFYIVCVFPDSESFFLTGLHGLRS